jgi:hypothetical protein
MNAINASTKKNNDKIHASDLIKIVIPENITAVASI